MIKKNERNVINKQHIEAVSSVKLLGNQLDDKTNFEKILNGEILNEEICNGKLHFLHSVLEGKA